MKLTHYPLIALSADEIVMDPNAVLGPVDPQLGTGQASFAAASILRALAQPNPNREDQTIILGDVVEKAMRQVKPTVTHQQRPGVEFIPMPYAPRAPAVPGKTERPQA